MHGSGARFAHRAGSLRRPPACRAGQASNGRSAVREAYDTIDY